MAISKKKKGTRTVFRFDVSYIDPFGVRRRKCSKWFETRAECLEAERDFLELAKKPSVRASFGSCCMKWIELSNPNITPIAKRDKIALSRRYCAPFWDQPVSAVSVEMVKAVLSGKDLEQRSTDIKNRVHATIKGTLNYACLFCGLQVNVMDYIPRFRFTDKERMREMQILSPAEMSRLEDYIENEEVRALLHVLYWTGMRLNECRSLRFKDLKNGKIFLREQFNDRTKKWTTLKTKNSVRNINLDDESLAVIYRQKDLYKNIPGFTEEWFIFGGFKKLAYTTIKRVKDEALESAGIPYFRIHDLRHSHVSYLLDAGVDFYRISRRLGHSSISITLDRYGHLLDDSESDIIAAIDAGKMRENVKKS